MDCSTCGGLLLSFDPGPRCSYCVSLAARIRAGEPDPRANRGELRKLFDALGVPSRELSPRRRLPWPLVLIWMLVLIGIAIARLADARSSAAVAEALAAQEAAEAEVKDGRASEVPDPAVAPHVEGRAVAPVVDAPTTEPSSVSRVELELIERGPEEGREHSAVE